MSKRTRSAGSIKESLRVVARISQGNPVRDDIIKSAVEQALLYIDELEQTILLYNEV